MLCPQSLVGEATTWSISVLGLFQLLGVKGRHLYSPFWHVPLGWVSWEKPKETVTSPGFLLQLSPARQRGHISHGCPWLLHCPPSLGPQSIVSGRVPCPGTSPLPVCWL